MCISLCVYIERKRKNSSRSFFVSKKYIFWSFSDGEDGAGADDNGQGGIAADGLDDDRVAGSDSASVTSETSEKDGITLPTLEALEPESNG